MDADQGISRIAPAWNQQRARGLAPLDAVREAEVSRFRPVLMTSLSTILGVMPIALALGAGSESRRSMRIAVVGGLVIGTALTLFVLPAVYSILTGLPPRTALLE